MTPAEHIRALCEHWLPTGTSGERHELATQIHECAENFCTGLSWSRAVEADAAAPRARKAWRRE